MSNARDKANIPALNFSSTGIDDNATSTAITIDSSERVGIGTSSPYSILGGISLGVHNSSGASELNLLSSTSGFGALYFGDGTSGNSRYAGYIEYKHDDDYLRFATNSVERMRLNSTGLGIGTSNPLAKLDVRGSAIFNEGGSDVDFRVESNNNANMLFVDGGNDRIGVGTSSPEQKLDVNGIAQIKTQTSSTRRLRIKDSVTSEYFDIGVSISSSQPNLTFSDGASERMRIDVSGNLLVGTTNSLPGAGNTDLGISARGDGGLFASRNGGTHVFNRNTSDGDIINLRKDGTTVGSISSIGVTDVFLGSGDTGLRYRAAQDDIRPSDGSADRDNAIDLGDAAARFDDIFATNGTIQTSDQNEKQSIQSLTTAEMNVAKRLSPLIKTFKWNSAVEEKGDSARTHTGIIAQDVQQAFIDEELDASNYALFTSNTWWEKEISVEATEEKDAYTYIDTKEEATDGYTERTRLGVRYPELLCFIQAYNDQRFTELEARITTLEANNP